jgi:hypothetical protein
VWLEGLGKLKKNSPHRGLEPATFWPQRTTLPRACLIWYQVENKNMAIQLIPYLYKTFVSRFTSLWRMYSYKSVKSGVEINSNVKSHSFVLSSVISTGERLEKLILNLRGTVHKNCNTFKHITSVRSELLNASPKVRVFVHVEEILLSDCT